ncbi:hypothetical protein [Thalassospira xiamenensis]|nr:hypothetical protein [Thalassospira xiamenensis]
MKLEQFTRFLEIRTSRIAGIVISVQFIAALCGQANATQPPDSVTSDQLTFQGGTDRHKGKKEIPAPESKDLTYTKRQTLKTIRANRNSAQQRLCVIWARSVHEIRACFDE